MCIFLLRINWFCPPGGDIQNDYIRFQDLNVCMQLLTGQNSSSASLKCKRPMLERDTKQISQFNENKRELKMLWFEI